MTLTISISNHAIIGGANVANLGVVYLAGGVATQAFPNVINPVSNASAIISTNPNSTQISAIYEPQTNNAGIVTNYTIKVEATTGGPCNCTVEAEGGNGQISRVVIPGPNPTVAVVIVP